jgi:acyl-CoA synthetase (AMP-forming)/AMP-acid ligase II
MTNSSNERTELEQSIPERFREQLRAHSGQLAISSLGIDLTYAQLDRAANAVAQALLHRIDTRGERVLLLADQGTAAGIATLGILKAGAAYVPLDPRAGEQSLANIALHVEPVLVLAERRYLELAEWIIADPARCVSIEDACAQPNSSDPCLRICANAIAYVYFTSGTSGKPKGVYDSHRNVLHNIWRYTVNLDIVPDDRLSLL